MPRASTTDALDRLDFGEADLQACVSGRLPPDRRAGIEGFLACNPDLAAGVMKALHQPVRRRPGACARTRAEQAPNPARRVMLTNRWTRWACRDWRWTGISPARTWQAWPGYHHMGTTRMSGSPRNGVTDSHGRMHGVDNLFVVGSSVFPTSGWANPTLTVVALALRTGDRVASGLRRAAAA